jgi:PhoPQ-activated pathogenicity-related protein
MLWQNTEHLKQLKEKTMLHESIKQKQFTVKERSDYRLRVTQHKVIAPEDTYSLEFIQETLEDGKILSSQTYNFFITSNDLKVLCEGLMSE